MLYIRGHKIIKGYVGNVPISHVGFGKSGLIKIKKEGNLIAKYTANTRGVLPTFNDGYQYTVSETESNGVYTVELYSDSDFTSCSFIGKAELLTVDYLKITDKATTMENLFNGCKLLTTLDVSNFDTSNVTNMKYMFYNCNNLTSLDVSNFNTSKVANMSGFIVNTSVLQNFISCVMPVSFEASSTALTHDSLMSIINNLATVTTTQTLTLGSTNLAKLTVEEIAIATNKGWTVK